MSAVADPQRDSVELDLIALGEGFGGLLIRLFTCKPSILAAHATPGNDPDKSQGPLA